MCINEKHHLKKQKNLPSRTYIQQNTLQNIIYMMLLSKKPWIASPWST